MSAEKKRIAKLTNPFAMPNLRSNLAQMETARSIIIDRWYRRIGLNRGVRSERVLRLCRQLSITPYELASLLVLPHSKFIYHLRKGVIPPEMSLGIAVLEAWHASEVLKQKTEPVIPLNLI